MSSIRSRSCGICAAALVFLATPGIRPARQAATPSRLAPDRWAAVARTLGMAGEIRGEVFRLRLAPFAGRIWMAGAPLAADVVEESWVSFGQQNVLGWMMGQVLLPAAQAGKVAGRLARQGLEVTGIVDPLPGSTPPITLIRFRGMGDATTLAGELKQALGALLRPAPNPNPDTGRLDAAKIERVLGRRGEADSGALVFRIARAEHVKCCGLENDPLLVFSGLPLGPATGMESRFAFEAVGARAVAVGRLAVRRAEAGPVERALSIFGLDTVALAELLPDEEPRIFFLYFFGRGNPLELAQGLRAAVERMNPLPPVNKP